ncbi:MAG: hypothetical protein PHH08_01285 [Candidatus ainarchaeum sp.]|nr:hypothetical protein [Candidatus ainarchaeum sp.]
MPNKPRKVQNGFLNVQGLVQAAKARGIPVSIHGLKAQIRNGKIAPDAYDDSRYRPSALFLKSRLDELFPRLPTRHLQPAGLMTPYQLLEEARKINPNINLSSIQQFLKKERESRPEQFKGGIIETHGKVKRELFPMHVGITFLEKVRQKDLSGLFSGYGHGKKSKKKQMPERKARARSQPMAEKQGKFLGKQIPLELLNTMYTKGMIRGRIMGEIAATKETFVSVERAAFLLGTTPNHIKRFQKEGYFLGRENSPFISLEELKSKFRQ